MDPDESSTEWNAPSDVRELDGNCKITVRNLISVSNEAYRPGGACMHVSQESPRSTTFRHFDDSLAQVLAENGAVN